MYAEGHDEGRLANQKHMAQIVLKNFNAPAMHEAIHVCSPSVLQDLQLPFHGFQTCEVDTGIAETGAGGTSDKDGGSQARRC